MNLAAYQHCGAQNLRWLLDVWKICPTLFMLIHLFRMTISSALLSQTPSIHDERQCSKSGNKISLGWKNILISISVQPWMSQTRVQAWLTGWTRTLAGSRQSRLTWSFKDTERNKNALLVTCQIWFFLYDPPEDTWKALVRVVSILLPVAVWGKINVKTLTWLWLT